jgi:hypothetical protein
MADRATGKVIRIFASSEDNTTFFRLNLDDPEQRPGGPNASEENDYNGYFYLLPTDPNYNALYSLLLVATTNERDVQAKVFGDGEIKPWRSKTDIGENAHVGYLVMFW